MNNKHRNPGFSDVPKPLITLCLCMPVHPSAAEDRKRRPIREFRTQDERLEFGNRRQIGESLYLTTLAELEWDRERRTSQDPTGSDSESGSAMVLQAGLGAVMTEQVQVELEAEYDSEDDKLIVNEAILAIERDPFEFEVGKDTLAFGEYFSRFTTGPLLEFGETTDKLAALSYSHPAGMELSTATVRASTMSWQDKSSRRGAELAFSPKSHGHRGNALRTIRRRFHHARRRFDRKKFDNRPAGSGGVLRRLRVHRSGFKPTIVSANPMS